MNNIKNGGEHLLFCENCNNRKCAHFIENALFLLSKGT